MTGESLSNKLPFVLVVLLLVVGVFMFYSQNQNLGAVTVCVKESCDGLDNDCDNLRDEGCDDDNDDYCDSSMTITTVYSCSDSIGVNCCPLGGGDCDDEKVAINPGVPEDCYTNDNENCAGFGNDECTPYSCSDSDPTNLIYRDGTLTITSKSGQVYSNNYPDFCANSRILSQAECTFSSSEEWYGGSIARFRNTTCPPYNFCYDPDGKEGATPAICK